MIIGEGGGGVADWLKIPDVIYFYKIERKIYALIGTK